MKFKSIFSLVIISFCSSLGLAQSDNCATATIIDLSTGTACVNGTTIGATSANTMYGACNAAPNNEVWYTYVSNGASNSFSVTSNGMTNAEIVVYTGGCTGQLELCNAVTGTTTLNSSWGISAGTQVWIGVMSNGGTQGGFQLCVNSNQPAPTGGNACSGAIPICDVNDVLSINMSTLSSSGTFPSCFLASVNQDVWFTFTVTQSGTIQWAATPTGAIAGVELDWAMYNVTSGCPGSLVACNYNYASATGASAGMSNTSCIGCPTSGFAAACAEYCAPANVVAGQTYAIMVDYFTGGATGSMNFGFLPGTTALIAPVSNFTINPATYTCGASVSVAITNSSVGGPQNWDFGNGNTYVGTNPPNQTYTTPGVYAITETIGGSCPTYHTEFVELYAPLFGTVNSTDAQCSSTCDGTATVTSVSGGDGVYTYLWSNAGETTNSVTGLCPGAYTVTISNALCGSNVVLPVNISQVGVLPNANAGGAQVLNCTNTNAQLNGSSSTAGVSFSWTGPGIVSGGNTATPTVNQQGNYVLTITDGGGACSSTANVNVTQNITPPNANAGSPQLLNCTVTSVQLNGSSSTGGVTFSWSGPGITSGGATATPTVNQPGAYTLTVANPANGCIATANVNVTQNTTAPNSNAGLGQVISCASTSAQLAGSSSTAGTTFSWVGPGIVSGGNTATPTVNLAGAYTLTVTNPVNGCTSTSTVNVTNDVGIPTVNAGGPQVITCTNPNVVLNGSSSTAGVTFSWVGPGIVSGGNTATPTVNLNGAYTLTVYDGSNGCSANANVSVTLNTTLPNASAGAAQVLNCTATTVQFNGSSSTGGVSFSWSGPGIVSGGATAAPTVNQPGNYVLTITNPTNGCTNTANVNVTQNITPPNANAGAPQLLNCTVTSVQLNGSSLTGGVTFSWSGPGITSGGATATPTVNQPGAYTLTIANPANGCIATANVNVTQNTTAPNANAGPGQVISCASTSVQLAGSSSTAGTTFSWVGPGIVSGGNTTTPTVDQMGNYVLTVTDPSNGCTATSNVNVAGDAGVPNVNAGQPQVITCTNPTAVLNGSSSTGGVTFSWAGPGIVSGGNTATPIVNLNGSYTLTVNDPSNGCSAASSVNVTMNTTLPNANAGAAQVLNCIATTVQLNGSSSTGGVSFSWSGPGIVSGGATAAPTVNQPGNYVLTVTNPTNGCTNTANVNVTQDITVPSVNFEPDTIIGCDELLVNFEETSGQAGMNYQWDFGDQNSANGGASVSNFYTQTGCFDVSLTVTNPANGCSNSIISPSLICIVPMPNAEFIATPNNTTTTNTVVYFTNNSSGATSYSWDFGDNTNSVVVNPIHTYPNDESGSYVVELIAYGTLGCSDTAWVTIRIEEELIFYVPNTFTPDGDNYNEYFKPIFTSGFDPFDFTLLIFNRWGEIVWESHDASVGWDGMYGGYLVQDGTYTWKIEFKSSETDKRIMKTGHVSVIR